jgi:hypothetical protein
MTMVAVVFFRGAWRLFGAAGTLYIIDLAFLFFF